MAPLAVLPELAEAGEAATAGTAAEGGEAASGGAGLFSRAKSMVGPANLAHTIAGHLLGGGGRSQQAPQQPQQSSPPAGAAPVLMSQGGVVKGDPAAGDSVLTMLQPGERVVPVPDGLLNRAQHKRRWSTSKNFN
jgi:hypothetical protein